jgi:hypothetical protein
MSELENRYAGLFGSKTSKGQVRGGFFLLGTGALLGLAALILFFIGRNVTDGTSTLTNPYFDWAKPALAMAPLALGLILLGITVALPTRTGWRVASYIGLTLCLVAAALFFVHYPENFNVSQKGSTKTDYMAYDVPLFVAGVVLMGGAIITSIVGFYLGKTTVVQGEGSGEEEDIYGAGYEVPDWVVEKDIEYAMKKYGVEWGGDGNTSSDKSIQVNMKDSFAGATIGGLGKARVVQLDSEQVDMGVKGLTRVRPQKGGALPSEWTDEATRALVAFRRQKQENPKAYTPKRGFWAKVKDFFTGRSSRPAPQASPSTPAVKAPARKGPASNGAAPAARRGKTIVIDDEK